MKKHEDERRKRESSEDAAVGSYKHYRFWYVITAILLLALCSMFTGSLTLKLSAANILRFHHNSESSNLNDVDILELEEREKIVRRMWDVYTHHSAANRLPRFWSQAFEAAYEDLISENRGVREVAVSEIAKMSLLHLNQLKNREVSRKIKQGVEKSAEYTNTVDN